MKKIILVLFVLLAGISLKSQNADSLVLKQIFNNAITNYQAYNNLKYLCSETPGRLMGTDNSIKALNYFRTYLEDIGCDTVYLQEYKTHIWKHIKSEAKLISGNETINLSIAALGESGSTPEDGISVNVIEVQGIKELKQLNPEDVKGKIVFFNRPVNQTFVNTFPMYGDAVDQRARGPIAAAEMGAAAALVRSVTTKNDDNPHTGNTHLDNVDFPAAGIGIISADRLSDMLKKDKNLKVNINIQLEQKDNAKTYNLIADIKGKTNPEEVIVIGGHIDAWFNAQGAHDDGAGIVQTADVLRIFKDLKLQNKRTIRFVAFMDEEYSQSGSKAFANRFDTVNEKLFFALESDAGGFTPEGFTMRAKEEHYKQISVFQKLLSTYGIDYIKQGGAGVDIYPLKKFGVPLIEFRTDSQRYFDYHHSANDSFDKVNRRELQMGTSCITGLVFLLDKYGQW